MDYSNIGQTLWNMGMTIIKTISTVWEWLNSSIEIGSLKFTPIAIGGGVIVALLVLALVKTFIPMA